MEGQTRSGSDSPEGCAGQQEGGFWHCDVCEAGTRGRDGSSREVLTQPRLEPLLKRAATRQGFILNFRLIPRYLRIQLIQGVQTSLLPNGRRNVDIVCLSQDGATNPSR